MIAAQHDHRWTERPVLSGLVGATSFLLPIVVSAAAAIAVSRILPRPDGLGAAILWWGGLTAVTVLALMLVDRLARRLLPLAALLRMSMLFPDRAPSRFRVAFRAGTVRALERRVQHARTHGLHDEPAKAAEKILTLAAALSAHDRKTRGHSERVRAFTDLLATEMKLAPEDRDRLRWAALLHDIGKLGVSPAILNKQGEPDEDEWAVIHRHPEEGARLVSPLRSWLGDWAAAIEHHHEKWDGSGYPAGLSGEEISLGARIVAVADSYEVMTAVRSYKKSLSAAEARRELAKCAGSHFDPVVVRAFLNVSLGRLRWAMGPIAWLVELPFVGGLPRAAVGAAAPASPATAGMATAALAVGTLGMAGWMSAEDPTVATATEQTPPATSQVGGIEIERDDGLERLVVTPATGGHADAASGGDTAPPSVASAADTAPATDPLPPPARGAEPPPTTPRERVLGESYEAPTTTRSAPPPTAAAPAGRTGGTPPPPAPQPAERGRQDDGERRDRPVEDAGADDRDDGGDDGDADEKECEASERGLERGAAEDHPYCDFQGLRDDG